MPLHMTGPPSLFLEPRGLQGNDGRTSDSACRQVSKLYDTFFTISPCCKRGIANNRPPSAVEAEQRLALSARHGCRRRLEAVLAVPWLVAHATSGRTTPPRCAVSYRPPEAKGRRQRVGGA
jgi:hypothetical protein